MPPSLALRALVLLSLVVVPPVAASPAAAQADPVSVWFLAEGTTRDNFAEFILLFNPHAEPVAVTVRYLVDAVQGTSPPPRTLTIPPTSRLDVKPFEELGRGVDHGTVVSAGRQIVVERALYLHHQFPNAGRVNGAAAVFALDSPRAQWAFAEGTTLPGFDTFYLLSNPGTSAASVSYSLGVSDGAVIEGVVTVVPGARVTLRADELIGAGREGVSATFTSPLPFLAERAVYFNTSLAGSPPVNGAHAESGAQPNTAFGFAEGTVLEGWYEFLTLGNPGPAPLNVTLSYQFEGEPGPTRSVTVPGRGRTTVQVFNAEDPGGVGRDVSDPVSRGVSVRATAAQPFVMERPVYYAGVDLPRLAAVDGGHVSKGIAGHPATVYAFAEGTTLPDFDTFFTFQNPTTSDAALEISYFTDLGAVVRRTLSLPAGRRVTTQVWNPLENGKGALGQDGRSFGALVAATNGVPFLVERPVYTVRPFPGITASVNAGTVAAGLPADGTLSLVLTSDGDDALLGETVTYQLAVSHAGVRLSDGGIATVALPPGFSYLGAGQGDDCTASGMVVTCSLAGLGQGSDTQVEIRTRVGGAPVTAVARATVVGAGVAPGFGTVAVSVAETTLALEHDGNLVSVRNTGATPAREVVVEASTTGALTMHSPGCGQQPEAGGLLVCLVDLLEPGAEVSLFSATGVTADAKGTNTTRAALDGTATLARPPAPAMLTGTAAVRAFAASGGVRLRPDAVAGAPALEAIPALGVELVGGRVDAVVTATPPSATAITDAISPTVDADIRVTWVEADGTRFDLTAAAVSGTASNRAYYESGGVAFDTRQHGATGRPDGPGSVPAQFAQVLVKGRGTLTRTSGFDGSATVVDGAGFTLSLAHGIDPPGAQWRDWAKPGPTALGTMDFGSGFTTPAGQPLVYLTLQWQDCPNLWSGNACPFLEGVPARSIVFTNVEAVAGFRLSGL